MKLKNQEGGMKLYDQEVGKGTEITLYDGYVIKVDEECAGYYIQDKRENSFRYLIVAYEVDERRSETMIGLN